MKQIEMRRTELSALVRPPKSKFNSPAYLNRKKAIANAKPKKLFTN